MYKERKPTKEDILSELSECAIPYRILDPYSSNYMVIRTQKASGDELLTYCLNYTMLCAYTHIVDEVTGIYDIHVRLYYRGRTN